MQRDTTAELARCVYAEYKINVFRKDGYR